MSKLKIEDFEVISDPNSEAGCEKCYFQSFTEGCVVFHHEIGIDLEKKHGSCFDEPEHYYKLKTKK